MFSLVVSQDCAGVLAAHAAAGKLESTEVYLHATLEEMMAAVEA